MPQTNTGSSTVVNCTTRFVAFRVTKGVPLNAKLMAFTVKFEVATFNELRWRR